MDEERFKAIVQDFFAALKEKTLLIIIDSASKYEKAVFSLVCFKDGEYKRFSPMLRELGFKNYRGEDELFVTYCSGRFSLFILDNIGNELRKRGVELPEGFTLRLIQNQDCI